MKACGTSRAVVRNDWSRPRDEGQPSGESACANMFAEHDVSVYPAEPRSCLGFEPQDISFRGLLQAALANTDTCRKLHEKQVILHGSLTKPSSAALLCAVALCTGCHGTQSPHGLCLSGAGKPWEW